MDWYLILILCAKVFVCHGTKEWDMLATNICQLYLSMNQCWEYQTLIGLAMFSVDCVSLGNRRKQNIQALRHQLHLNL